MKKIVGLGACVLDTIINCESYPIEDKKVKAQSVFVSGGGPVGNALVVTSKLGVQSEIIGNFADDSASNYLINDFKKYGVETAHVTRVRDKSSFTSYIVLSEESKTRTCVFDRGSVPDDAELIDCKPIDDAYILHLDGNYLSCAIKSAEYAKSKGVLVSLDGGGLYKDIDKLIPLVDILIMSVEFCLGFTKEEDIERALYGMHERFNPKVLVATDGADGGYYFEDGKVYHYDSIKVDAVDTNGAGDTFHGAFLVAYCMGKTVKECCEFASVVAGYKCTFKGARTYPLSLEIINEKIKRLKLC